MLYKFLSDWENIPKLKFLLNEFIPLFAISEYLTKILIKDSFVNCPSKTLEYDCLIMSNPIDSDEIVITDPLLAIYFEFAMSWDRPIPVFALNSAANLMSEIIQQKWNESTNPHLIIEKIYFTFFKVSGVVKKYNIFLWVYIKNLV